MLVAQSCLTLSNHMDYSLQDPLFMEFSSKNTGVGSHSLLQRIFLTQGLNLGLLYCRQILQHLNHQGVCVCVRLVAQSCPTLCDPTECSLPGSSLYVDSPGSTGMGCHALLQGIFLEGRAQGLNPGHQHCRWILHHLSHRGI